MTSDSLMSRLSRLLRGRAAGVEVPQPPVPTGTTVSVDPAGDAPEPVPEPLLMAEVPAIAGMTFLIEYVDAAERLSRRRVTLRSLEERYDRTYLRAFCHERRAERTFRADRLRSILDVRTGERFDAPLEFLQSLTQQPIRELQGFELPRDQDRAFDRCRDGIRVLVFLARCDGVLHASERDIIATYCRLRCMDPRYEQLEYKLEHLLQYADRQHPDVDTFNRCVDRLIERASTGEHVRLLFRSAMALIDADGALTDAEVEFGREMYELLSGQGLLDDVQ